MLSWSHGVIIVQQVGRSLNRLAVSARPRSDVCTSSMDPPFLPRPNYPNDRGPGSSEIQEHRKHAICESTKQTIFTPDSQQTAHTPHRCPSTQVLISLSLSSIEKLSDRPSCEMALASTDPNPQVGAENALQCERRHPVLLGNATKTSWPQHERTPALCSLQYVHGRPIPAGVFGGAHRAAAINGALLLSHDWRLHCP
jgi:hypothetical protein